MAGTAPAPPTGGDLHAFKTFLPFFWPKNDRVTRLRLVAALVLMGVTAGLAAIAPLIFATAVDALSGEQAAFLPAALLIGYGVVFATSRALMELRWVIVGPFDQSVRGNIVLAAFERVHQLGLRFHLSRKTGQLVDVINRGMGAAWQLIFGILMTLVPVVMDIAVVASVLLTRFDVIYAVLIVLTAALYIASLVIGAEKHRPYQRKAIDEWGEIWGQAVDGLLNYETVKYFNAEGRTVRRLDTAIRAYERTCAVALNVRLVTTLIPIAIMGAGFTLMIWLAGRQTLAGEMTIGGLVLVNLYLVQVLLPLERVAQLYRDTKQALISVEALMRLFAETPDVVDAPGAAPLPRGPGTIAFRNVSFAYDSRRPILTDVSFEVPAGTTVALVGASGAGKTTVGRLLFRFWEPQSGAIEVNGRDIREVTVDSLRAAIGVVPQDTVLFNESIASNLAFAVGGVSRAEVERAARLAHLHEFIAALPDGYDAVVGQRGLKLSGGEKQRVAIARALLKQPSIFLFDEATSSLDTQTERVIQENLREISRGATTLVIAHRLSTVVHAEQILVFDHGRIVERGTHAALLELGGKYAALWARQQDEQQPVAAE